MNGKKFAQGLRELADAFENAPDDVIPYDHHVSIFAESLADLRRIASLFSGAWKSRVGDKWFYLEMSYAGRVRLQICVEDSSVINIGNAANMFTAAVADLVNIPPQSEATGAMTC